MLDYLARKNALHWGVWQPTLFPYSPSLRAMSRFVRRHKPRQLPERCGSASSATRWALSNVCARLVFSRIMVWSTALSLYVFTSFSLDCRP